MGMQTPSFQQPPQPSGKGPQQYSQPSQPIGKGMAQPTRSNPVGDFGYHPGYHPVGDFGDPNYDQDQSLPSELQKYAPNVMPQPRGFPSPSSGQIGNEAFNAPTGGFSEPMVQGGSGKFFDYASPQPNMPMSAFSQQPQQQGKGGTTNAVTSGQPRMGRPNNYSNTVGPWDNASIQPQTQSGKGKGH